MLSLTHPPPGVVVLSLTTLPFLWGDYCRLTTLPWQGLLSLKASAMAGLSGDNVPLFDYVNKYWLGG